MALLVKGSSLERINFNWLRVTHLDQGSCRHSPNSQPGGKKILPRESLTSSADWNYVWLDSLPTLAAKRTWITSFVWRHSDSTEEVKLTLPFCFYFFSILAKSLMLAVISNCKNEQSDIAPPHKMCFYYKRSIINPIFYIVLSCATASCFFGK